MGSRVQIRLFQMLHFVRDLLFPLFKNSKSGVDDRGHRLRITHTLRRFPRYHFSDKNLNWIEKLQFELRNRVQFSRLFSQFKIPKLVEDKGFKWQQPVGWMLNVSRALSEIRKV